MSRFTDTHVAFRESVRRMVETKIKPIAAQIDESDHIPEDLISTFGEMGLLQILVPKRYGGPGGDLTSVCIAKEEISKVSLACAVLPGHNSIAMVQPLMHFGTEYQREKWLPMVAEGRTLNAVAITEPESGSDAASMRTRAERDGNSYIINGQKSFISWGNVAHYVTVFARTSVEKGFKGVSCFIVEANTPGLHVGKVEKKMGLNGVPNVALHFDNVKVPAENMIGEEGRGFLAAMRALDMNRPTVGAAAVGLAQGALDHAIDYAKIRKQFGKPIGDFQGLQWMLADMAMQVEAARSLVYECCYRIDAGDYARLTEMASMAKCFASDVAMKVTTDAVQIFGGIGYMRDCPVEKLMRDAKVLQIYEGTNQIQRTVIARHILGKS